LASALVGLGSGGGSLEKLTIRRTGRARSRPIEALFNPSEISISRSVTYEQKEVASQQDAADVYAVQKLKSVEPATLRVDLFFDTYESRDDTASFKRVAASVVTPLNPFQTGDASPVTALTDEVEALALPDRETHQPPTCELSWGDFDIFEGVLTQLDQRFTMFLTDGTPVRATLSCTFVENRSEAYRKATELHSADVAKTWVVRRNDSLQSIAAEQYGDPALWRAIATANGIVNPRVLPPGTVLMIPKLRP
jgi:nucleoid-associated protein YgaU